ncbi:MAG: ribonuclease H-like domain-containing protein [Thermodesulfobacteriota bacterium]
MLTHTFQHIRGISPKGELTLWESGIFSWDELDATRSKQLALFKEFNNQHENSPIALSKVALEKEDANFFAKCLSRQEYYRIALTFPEKTLFLDIETTGLSRYYDTITLIGWSIGKEYGLLIKGDSDKLFRTAISNAKAIVTFNGSLFDLPFLNKEFQDLSIPICHIDLRFFARRVGLSGGQKEIEKLLKVKRPKNIADIKGETAALLSYKYRWGDLSALKQLIIYNHADIEGMKVIFDKVVERLLKKKRFPLSVNSIHQFAKNRTKIKWSRTKSLADIGIQIRPYKGKSGPIISLRDLTSSYIKNNIKIVGIDLTGSENRPSGWCFLDYDRATTNRLNSDAEIIDETITSHPTLVSIDSPLSIPAGRVSVGDNDPGRDEFGIMRYCERLLKKRGVNVYPSLIPSMQKLTARGIRLADHFRSLGIPVIESYPGAAQDIMGIPRKRISLEFLSKGLEKFGVKGDFIKKPVTHDELDAITSATVGLFFWGGKFEALGNEDEDYLIIPDLETNPDEWRKRRVIGLSGPIYAGKTTIGNFLKTKRFNYGRYSLVLEKLLKERNRETSRQNLQQIGEKINKDPGQRWLCRKLVQMLPDKGDIVIDGMRYPEDHAYLIETFGPAFLHVHINAPNDIRLERYVLNGYNEADFITAISHPVEAKVKKMASLAHFVIDNSSTIKTFKSKITKAINKNNKMRGKYKECL